MAESARQAVFAAAWQVRGELRKALLDLTAAERRRTGLQAQVEVQQRIVALLDRRRQAGAVGAHEVAVARVALVRAEAAAADAGRHLPPIRQRIAQALGISVSALAGVSLAPPALPGPLSAEQLGAARRLALQNRGDVLGALARFEAAQSALDFAVAKQRPDFHLGPGYQWDQGENKWSLALTLELPLFNQNQGPIAEAEARRREAAAQVLAVQARALGEIESALAVQQVAVAQIEQFGRIQTALAQQAAAVTARLRAGGADQLESETVRLERTAAELALLDAQAQAAAAAGQLEDALQVPFPNLTALAQSGRAPSTATSP